LKPQVSLIVASLSHDCIWLQGSISQKFDQELLQEHENTQRSFGKTFLNCKPVQAFDFEDFRNTYDTLLYSTDSTWFYKDIGNHDVVLWELAWVSRRWFFGNRTMAFKTPSARSKTQLKSKWTRDMARWLRRVARAGRKPVDRKQKWEATLRK